MHLSSLAPQLSQTSSRNFMVTIRDKLCRHCRNTELRHANLQHFYLVLALATHPIEIICLNPCKRSLPRFCFSAAIVNLNNITYIEIHEKLFASCILFDRATIVNLLCTSEKKQRIRCVCVVFLYVKNIQTSYNLL